MRAVIGCHGQDGTLLTEQLRAEGQNVIGVGKMNITDSTEVEAFLREYNPAELYYLAAFHHSSEDALVLEDFELFRKSFDVHFHGLVCFLEAIKKCIPKCRLLYAASSHVFGEPTVSPQNEQTPLQPCNIYGISKAAGIQACRYYRQNHALYATNAILYNHESPYRKPQFVSQKIVRAALAIKQGKQNRLILGDLDAAVDWGYAPDYIDAMRRCLKLEQSDDFVVATGETHTVQEFVEIAFGELGLDWRKYVHVNPRLLTKPRITLKGDSTKLKLATGWKPTMNFPGIIQSLLVHSLQYEQANEQQASHGFLFDG